MSEFYSVWSDVNGREVRIEGSYYSRREAEKLLRFLLDRNSRTLGYDVRILTHEEVEP